MNSSDTTLVANQVGEYELPDTYEEFNETFPSNYKKLIDAVNSKEGALYLPQELATFQRYVDPGDPQNTLNVYRKLVDFGPLPNTTTKRVQHNINFNENVRLTRLYGAATNPSNIQFIPLPFASTTLANNVILQADEEDIIITTGADYSGYKFTTVVMEYTK